MGCEVACGLSLQLLVQADPQVEDQSLTRLLEQYAACCREHLAERKHHHKQAELADDIGPVPASYTCVHDVLPHEGGIKLGQHRERETDHTGKYRYAIRQDEAVEACDDATGIR